MSEHSDELGNKLESIKGFFGAKIASFQGKKRDSGSRQADETMAGIQAFIKTGGSDVLAGKQTLALLTKTARHVNAKYRELHRHTELEEADRGDAEALEEITSFFSRLHLIRFKKEDPDNSAEELSEVNLELFPQASTIHISGITVIHVKCGNAITRVIADSNAAFSPGVSVFPNCTSVVIEACDVTKIVRVIEGTLAGLSVNACEFTMATLGDNMKKLENLTRLEVCGCKWESIPAGLGKLRHLEELSLAGNEISQVENLGECEQLTYLDISNNRITSLEPFFESTQKVATENIATLNASDNPIVELKGLGPWMKSLTSLDLTSCRVSDWEQEIPRLSRLPHLVSLWLQGNPAYTCPRLLKAPRQHVIELLTDIAAPEDFMLDGMKLAKADVRHLQDLAKAKVDAPGSPNGELEEEWPEVEPSFEMSNNASSPPAQAVAVTSPTSPTSPVSKAKVVKRKVKAKKEKKSVSATVQGPGRSSVDRGTDCGSQPTGVAVDAGSSLGTWFRDGIFKAVKERLSGPVYQDVVTGSVKEWDFGVVMSAIIHSCCAAWIDYLNMIPANTAANLTQALSVADAKLGISQPAQGTAMVDSPQDLSQYLSLLLLSVQRWEASQYQKAKALNTRLASEIARYRAQRKKDRRRIEDASPRGPTDDTSSLNHTLTKYSDYDSDDSAGSF